MPWTKIKFPPSAFLLLFFFFIWVGSLAEDFLGDYFLTRPENHQMSAVYSRSDFDYISNLNSQIAILGNKYKIASGGVSQKINF